SSARSILWVMKAEYSKVDGWKEWYDSESPSIEERQLLKKLNDIRVRTQKISPIDTYIRAVLNVNEDKVTEEMKSKLRKMDKKEVEFTVSAYDLENEPVDDEKTVTFHGKLAGYHHELEDFPKSDIKEICVKYINSLEAI